MRDTGIDAYRCLLMFGICLLHAIEQIGHNVPWVANMLSHGWGRQCFQYTFCIRINMHGSI